MGSELGIGATTSGDGMTSAAHLYQWLVQIGSTANRIVNPNPDRLGTPLPPAARAAKGVALAEPIILVGGYASMIQSLEPLARSLRADGFQVFVFDVPNNGLADLYHSGREFEAFVADVRKRTGAARVDVIAHSAGGMVVRTWAQLQGGASKLDQLVTIATPHHGVVLLRSKLVNSVADSRLGRWFTGGSTKQLLYNSPHMQLLERTFPSLARAGARLTSIFVDGYDGLLAPINTAVVEGAENIRLEHAGRSVGDANLGHFTLHRRNDFVYDLVRGVLLR